MRYVNMREVSNAYVKHSLFVTAFMAHYQYKLTQYVTGFIRPAYTGNGLKSSCGRL